MDPALREVLAAAGPDDELEVVLFLEPGREVPHPARLVSRLGDVATCRLPAAALTEVRAHPWVRSAKASRIYGGDQAVPWWPVAARSTPRMSPPWPRRAVAGRGVVVACLDWGCDVAHPNFRTPDGKTRLLALWDQRGPSTDPRNGYGYGTVHTSAAIDAALATDDPYAALGYRPPVAAHGTHVLDIAAGNGRQAGSRPGLAPEASLLFVHLAARNTPRLGHLGDSVRLLEAIAFVRDAAGERPWVCNLSLGRTGGDHSGSSIVEQALDAVVQEQPGRAIVQSAGNYFHRRIHSEGWLRPGGASALHWLIDPADVTPNELEIWYSGRDRLGVAIDSPDGARFSASLGQAVPIFSAGREVGRLYHRERDPLNGDHHIDVFLYPSAPPGRWRVELRGEDVIDGRYHAWIERDVARPGAQSSFPAEQSSARSTIGTIANGFRTIVVGACDPATGQLARFSSSGPTRDGRTKPDLVAPGVGIVAARSGPVPGVVAMSGTSMAAPHVAGTVALMFEAAGRRLRAEETRALLLGTADELNLDPIRIGAGLLNTDAAVRAAACVGGERRERAMIESELDADALFRSLIYGGESPEGIEVLGFPDEPLLAELRPGDVLLRQAPGEPGLGGMFVLSEGALAPPSSMQDAGLAVEPEGEGGYAAVRAHGANGVARRIVDDDGRLPLDQMLLRFVDDEALAERVASTAAPALAGKDVLKFARVIHVSPHLSLRSRPDGAAPVLEKLQFNDRVFVVKKLDAPPGWSLVSTDNGNVGYIWDIWLMIDPPEPDAILHKIQPGESPIGIAEKYYKGAVGWGHDLRFYVNVLVYVNRAEGDKKKGIHKRNKDDSWRQTTTRAGVYIWVPSVKFADGLRGHVSSGSITYSAWRAFVDLVEAAWEWVKFGAAFVAGLLHGALEAVWDVIVGAKDLVVLVWDLLETLIRGEILSKARELYDALTWDKVKDAVVDWLGDVEAKWNASSSLKRGHYRGWVCGYIVAEVLMAIFTAGSVTAVKWAGRLGKFAKLLKSLGPIRKIADKGEDLIRKGAEKAKQARAALKSMRARRRLNKALGDGAAARLIADVGEDVAVKLLDDLGEALLRDLVSELSGKVVLELSQQIPKAHLAKLGGKHLKRLMRESSIPDLKTLSPELVRLKNRFGNTFERVFDLSIDPADGGRRTAKSLREAEVGLEIEARGQIPGPIVRSTHVGSEFVDANGVEWDVKGFRSGTGRGAFNLATDMRKIELEIRVGENVIVDTAKMSTQDIAALKVAIAARVWAGRIRWYP